MLNIQEVKIFYGHYYKNVFVRSVFLYVCMSITDRQTLYKAVAWSLI